MGRMYTVPFKDVAVTAEQDFFEINAAAGKPLIIHEIVLGQENSVTSEMLSVAHRRGDTVSGSGGSAPTPIKMNSSDAAAGFTAEVNNTTKANTSGETVRVEAFNILNGYHFLPTPEERPVIAGGQRWCLELCKVPSASLTMHGTMVVEEIG